jgi:peptidoglycan/LPS O-acetylase OafA/YrhL
VGAWINGQSGIGYFPALPWLAYVWIGVAVGRLLWRRMQQRGGDPGPLAGPLLLAALGCFALMLVVPNVGFRHPRLAHICLTLALAFGLWALLDALNRAGDLPRCRVVVPLALLGEVSLMLYALHHLIGYRLLALFGWVTGRAWRGEYGVMTPAQAAGGLLLMLVLCGAAAAPWKRLRGPLESAVLGHVRSLRRPAP